MRKKRKNVSGKTAGKRKNEGEIIPAPVVVTGTGLASQRLTTMRAWASLVKLQSAQKCEITELCTAPCYLPAGCVQPDRLRPVSSAHRLPKKRLLYLPDLLQDQSLSG